MRYLLTNLCSLIFTWHNTICNNYFCIYVLYHVSISYTNYAAIDTSTTFDNGIILVSSGSNNDLISAYGIASRLE